MTILPNPPSLKVTIAWESAAVPIKDDAGIYQARLTLSAASSSNYFIKLQVTGTAIYNVDFKLSRGTSAGGSDYWVEIQGGVTTFDVAVLINQNNDPTETIIMTILPGAGYVVGATPATTITMTNGATMPTFADWGIAKHGLDEGDLQPYNGGDVIHDGDFTGNRVYRKKIEWGGGQGSGLQSDATDLVFEQCVIRATSKLAYAFKANGSYVPKSIRFIDCDFVGLSHAAYMGRAIQGRFAQNSQGDPGLTVTGCRARYFCSDFIQLSGNTYGARVLDNYVSESGCWDGSNPDSSPHTDFFQLTNSSPFYVEDILIQGNNWDWPIEDAHPGHGSNAFWQLDNKPITVNGLRAIQNWIAGGNNTFDNNLDIQPSGIEIRNNLIFDLVWDGASVGDMRYSLLSTDWAQQEKRSGNKSGRRANDVARITGGTSANFNTSLVWR
jgi:hypothetical protein